MSKYLWTYHVPEHHTIDASTKETMPTPMSPLRKTNTTMWLTLQGNRTTNVNAQKDHVSTAEKWDISPKIAAAIHQAT
jgi:hypothetical protein